MDELTNAREDRFWRDARSQFLQAFYRTKIAPPAPMLDFAIEETRRMIEIVNAAMPDTSVEAKAVSAMMVMSCNLWLASDGNPPSILDDDDDAAHGDGG